MPRSCYETLQMAVVDQDNLYRFVTSDGDEGMVVLAYEEWDEDTKSWKRSCEMHMPAGMGPFVAEQLRKVSLHVQKEEEADNA